MARQDDRWRTDTASNLEHATAARISHIAVQQLDQRTGLIAQALVLLRVTAVHVSRSHRGSRQERRSSHGPRPQPPPRSTLVCDASLRGGAHRRHTQLHALQVSPSGSVGSQLRRTPSGARRLTRPSKNVRWSIPCETGLERPARVLLVAPKEPPWSRCRFGDNPEVAAGLTQHHTLGGKPWLGHRINEQVHASDCGSHCLAAIGLDDPGAAAHSFAAFPE